MDRNERALRQADELRVRAVYGHRGNDLPRFDSGDTVAIWLESGTAFARDHNSAVPKCIGNRRCRSQLPALDRPHAFSVRGEQHEDLPARATRGKAATGLLRIPGGVEADETLERHRQRVPVPGNTRDADARRFAAPVRSAARLPRRLSRAGQTAAGQAPASGADLPAQARADAAAVRQPSVDPG